MERLRDNIDRYTGGPMFVASMLFLLLLAGVLHFVEENGIGSVWTVCCWGLLVLYPLFLVEFLLHLVLGSPVWKQRLLSCLIPPLRLGGRDFETGQRIWLPLWGWTPVDEELVLRLEKHFSLPMILIALMVLPLMAVENFWSERISTDPNLAFYLQLATGLIWLAFTFEFLVMISIVERKVRYCKEHWIDIAVICLPLIAFLRTARLGRLLRLNSLAKTARAYRLRGLLMRTYRAFLVLEVIQRLLRPDPQKRLAQLREILAEKEAELEELRSEMRRLEGDLSAEQSTVPQEVG